VEHGARLFEQPTCLHRPEVYAGLGEAESAELLRDFFARGGASDWRARGPGSSPGRQILAQPLVPFPVAPGLTRGPRCHADPKPQQKRAARFPERPFLSVQAGWRGLRSPCHPCRPCRRACRPGRACLPAFR
jgi:hypothetical protein